MSPLTPICANKTVPRIDHIEMLAFTSTYSPLALRSAIRRRLPTSHQNRASRYLVCSSVSAMRADPSPPLDGDMTLFAKAGPDGKSMGDCPFTMKANLALRFRGVEFGTEFIDLSNKPEWFLDLNEDGTTPVFVDGTVAIADSEEIIQYADKIGSAETAKLEREQDKGWDRASDAVSPVFGALVRLLKNKDEDEEQQKKDELAEAIRAVDAVLRDGAGPYLLGNDVSALDCNLGPKLQHIVVAAKHYKGFEIPDDCEHVKQYMTAIRQTEQWKAATCEDDVIVWGWSKFFT